ncbi:Phospholipase/carboxylesterase [Akanthomyces lecanii RCEF 1005]|uniref:Phospholipase/carboxylesterase n=1 Tax=Akanthomyces lecanii RCEF 1005 TaxID=1081108 RepID=A0A168GT33_CORDF|nr:Phospholipase/carboxylesterase [Akanthomyces lecanii RCEF 1005]
MHEEPPSDARSAGPVHVIKPQAAHTHTAIVLHGRGSNGPEFAEELFATRLSDNGSLWTKFPGWRWVFPSSKELWSTTFQEHMPAWFEAQSLTDTTLRQDLQIPGIMDSSAYIQGLIEEEVKILHGNKSNLLFGGISQGGAVAMWMLLCRGTESWIGAFFAASTWLPFAENIEKVLTGQGNEEAGTAGQDAAPMQYDSFIRQAMQDPETEQYINPMRSHMKVFLGHGLDDAYIDVELGRQARHVLTAAGFNVEWKEYTGAEEEGHWLQEPNEMDDIYQFMLKFSA